MYIEEAQGIVTSAVAKVKAAAEQLEKASNQELPFKARALGKTLKEEFENLGTVLAALIEDSDLENEPEDVPE